MEKNGLNTDILSEREERFDHVLSIFETVAENEERTEFNDALREMSILLREAAQDGDVMHAIRLERQCIALDQTRRPDRIDELNRQLLKSSAAEQGGIYFRYWQHAVSVIYLNISYLSRRIHSLRYCSCHPSLDRKSVV